MTEVYVLFYCNYMPYDSGPEFEGVYSSVERAKRGAETIIARDQASLPYSFRGDWVVPDKPWETKAECKRDVVYAADDGETIDEGSYYIRKCAVDSGVDVSDPWRDGITVVSTVGPLMYIDGSKWPRPDEVSVYGEGCVDGYRLLYDFDREKERLYRSSGRYEADEA